MTDKLPDSLRPFSRTVQFPDYDDIAVEDSVCRVIDKKITASAFIHIPNRHGGSCGWCHIATRGTAGNKQTEQGEKTDYPDRHAAPRLQLYPLPLKTGAQTKSTAGLVTLYHTIAQRQAVTVRLRAGAAIDPDRPGTEG
uniref:Uncharacterized protein n=1 Tax=Aquisalinus luteolus TaxID=1566827 RepID=A0A8J3A4T2_9PROT|nr:hypothetical protein GCM10011355_22460 [Aquisalinus luteolus]